MKTAKNVDENKFDKKSELIIQTEEGSPDSNSGWKPPLLGGALERARERLKFRRIKNVSRMLEIGDGVVIRTFDALKRGFYGHKDDSDKTEDKTDL